MANFGRKTLSRFSFINTYYYSFRWKWNSEITNEGLYCTLKHSCKVFVRRSTEERWWNGWRFWRLLWQNGNEILTISTVLILWHFKFNPCILFVCEIYYNDVQMEDEARLEKTPYPFHTQLIWRYLGIK